MILRCFRLDKHGKVSSGFPATPKLAQAQCARLPGRILQAPNPHPMPKSHFDTKDPKLTLYLNTLAALHAPRVWPDAVLLRRRRLHLEGYRVRMRVMDFDRLGDQPGKGSYA